ncbi:hypothetical protein LJC08_04255 [Methanimicrococcus sp. OttesenSCG-928-J09]|nr:hypothetical protein [Methanimicrococcus sp. OttesenSCG-928-J09]
MEETDREEERLEFNRNIHLQSISKSLNEDAFFTEFFPRLYEESVNNDFFRFTILYQVVEYLIDKILHPIVLREIKKNPETRELKDTLSERFRINILFNECVNLSNDVQRSFKDAYDKFIQHLGSNIESKNGSHNQIYFVRNTIYHNLRKLDNNFLEGGCLKEINLAFEKIILELLLNYNDISESSDSQATQTP